MQIRRWLILILIYSNNNNKHNNSLSNSFISYPAIVKYFGIQTFVYNKIKITSYSHSSSASSCSSILSYSFF